MKFPYQVALEGLDGITIPVLKYRLKKREDFTNFGPELTTEFLIGVLKELISNDVVEAYKLPEPRPAGKVPMERKCEDNDKCMILGKFKLKLLIHIFCFQKKIKVFRFPTSISQFFYVFSFVFRKCIGHATLKTMGFSL